MNFGSSGDKDLFHFLLNAPKHFVEGEKIRKFQLQNGDYIHCVLWNMHFYITGTDIVKILVWRFQNAGRQLQSIKKFEEGVFSDLRNLKPGIDATLEGPRSDFLEFLYKNGCIRTQKKQKVFYWYSVPHDALFCDALERDLRRETNLFTYSKYMSNMAAQTYDSEFRHKRKGAKRKRSPKAAPNAYGMIEPLTGYMDNSFNIESGFNTVDGGFNGNLENNYVPMDNNFNMDSTFEVDNTFNSLDPLYSNTYGSNTLDPNTYSGYFPGNMNSKMQETPNLYNMYGSYNGFSNNLYQYNSNPNDASMFGTTVNKDLSNNGKIPNIGTITAKGQSSINSNNSITTNSITANKIMDGIKTGSNLHQGILNIGRNCGSPVSESPNINQSNSNADRNNHSLNPSNGALNQVNLGAGDSNTNQKIGVSGLGTPIPQSMPVNCEYESFGGPHPDPFEIAPLDFSFSLMGEPFMQGEYGGFNYNNEEKIYGMPDIRENKKYESESGKKQIGSGYIPNIPNSHSQLQK